MGLELVRKSVAQLREESEFLRERELFREYVEIQGIQLLRGSLTEFVGGASSGKISFLFNLFSTLTQKGEVCAVVDVNNGFDPAAAAANSVVLENMLWVKCSGDLENAFTAADYLIQARGFGAIWLNLGHTPRTLINHIPTTSWYRFRTKVKDSTTIFVVTSSDVPVTGSASNQSLTFANRRTSWKGEGKFKLLQDFSISLGSAKPFIPAPVLKRVERSYGDE